MTITLYGGVHQSDKQSVTQHIFFHKVDLSVAMITNMKMTLWQIDMFSNFAKNRERWIGYDLIYCNWSMPSCLRGFNLSDCFQDTTM